MDSRGYGWRSCTALAARRAGRPARAPRRTRTIRPGRTVLRWNPAATARWRGRPALPACCGGSGPRPGPRRGTCRRCPRRSRACRLLVPGARRTMCVIIVCTVDYVAIHTAMDWGRKTVLGESGPIGARVLRCGTLADRVRLSRLNDAGFVGQDHGLDPVPEPELGQQVADVGLHGRLADHQVGGYLRVGQAAGQPQQDVALPAGQRGQPGWRWQRLRRPAGKRVDQPHRYRRREQRVPRGGDPDCGDQVVPRGVLQQESARPGPQRLVYVVVEVEGGQHDHPGPGGPVSAGDLPGGLEAVHFRHSHVHQDHVGLVVGGGLDGLCPVGCLGDHGDPVCCLEDHAESGPDQLLVIGDEYPDRVGAGHGAGSLAVTANPPAWPGPTVRLPPQDATRSAMPASPNPLLREVSVLPMPGGPAAAAGPWPVSVTETVTYPDS